MVRKVISPSEVGMASKSSQNPELQDMTANPFEISQGSKGDMKAIAEAKDKASSELDSKNLLLSSSSSKKGKNASKKSRNEQQQNTSVSDTNAKMQTSGQQSRRNHQRSKRSPPSAHDQDDKPAVHPTFAEYASKANELKEDIYKLLERQKEVEQKIDRPMDVVKLRDDVLKLSNEEAKDGLENANTNKTSKPEEVAHEPEQPSTDTPVHQDKTEGNNPSMLDEASAASQSKDTCPLDSNAKAISTSETAHGECSKPDAAPEVSIKKGKQSQRKLSERENVEASKAKDVQNLSGEETLVEFELLDAKLDENSKIMALISGFRRHFKEAPEVLEPFCKKLVRLSEQNKQLAGNCDNYQRENHTLSIVKEKLEKLCRELQRANNTIRVESLNLIQGEQGRAKEQMDKIQSTLSSVIKLFDENQQKNVNLRQDNVELQSKLRALLDHCDTWEKSVEIALRQKDIENRLLRTELAKANLTRNEESEAHLKEKQELLRLISMMQEQQQKIEGQEAKLRSDLSNYASKYDECQAAISKGMSKFRTESKRMLRQLEISKQDYKGLLTKYEGCTQKMSLLYEEKLLREASLAEANKKIETLEKLCRALQERKTAQPHDGPASGKQSETKGLPNKQNTVPVSSDCKKPKDCHDCQDYNCHKVDSSEFVSEL